MAKNSDRTVGSHVLDILEKGDQKQGVIDTQQEMHKTYIPQIKEVVKEHSDWEDPYYIVVRNKKEAYLPNVIRQQFWARRTRPAADYDLTLWHYTPKTGDLKWEWTVPDRATCSYLLLIEKELPPDHLQLLQCIKDFRAGKLDPPEEKILPLVST